MKKAVPLIQERAKADLRLIFLMARSKGINAIQVRNPKLNEGKERVRRSAEERANKILIIPVAL
jgi:hypothetical protein